MAKKWYILRAKDFAPAIVASLVCLAIVAAIFTAFYYPCSRELIKSYQTLITGLAAICAALIAYAAALSPVRESRRQIAEDRKKREIETMLLLREALILIPNNMNVAKRNLDEVEDQFGGGNIESVVSAIVIPIGLEKAATSPNLIPRFSVRLVVTLFSLMSSAEARILSIEPEKRDIMSCGRILNCPIRDYIDEIERLSHETLEKLQPEFERIDSETTID